MSESHLWETQNVNEQKSVYKVIYSCGGKDSLEEKI